MSERCKCTRIVSVNAKCSDMFDASLSEPNRNRVDIEGYVPRDLNVGGGDYVRFKYCADCGQIQNFTPLASFGLLDAKYNAE